MRSSPGVESDTTQYLFRYINLLEGKFYPKEYSDYLSRDINKSSDMSNLLNELDHINLLSVSDTEQLDNIEFEKLKKYSINILKVFSQKNQSWEFNE
ncbi:hypothetical protein BCS98_18475 [Vibrio breoganii]|nr:hypothetical protein BCS98_18475 [Vibrio breoganii]